MKTTSIINKIATIVGLSLGAFGLSVFAQTWTPAPPNPPSGNVAAPVNIGSVLQTRIGDLVINGGLSVGGIGILSNNFVFKPSAAPVTVGSVLTAKDTGGTVEWQAPGSASTAATCRLIGETATSLGWQTIATPGECIDNTCSLALAIFHTSLGTVNTVRSTMLTQFSATFPFGGSGPNWWVKPGSSNDGTSCALGRNGTTEGCDQIINWADEIIVYDDNTSGESISGQWTLRDTSSNYRANLYVCR